MNRALVCFIMFFTTSCATNKLYPVCNFGQSAPSEERQDLHVSALLTQMTKYDSTAHSTPDGRWIFGRTTRSEHKNLINTWPYAACIGDVMAGTQVKAYDDCISYVHYFLKKKKVTSLDIKEEREFSDEASGQPDVICYREQ